MKHVFISHEFPIRDICTDLYKFTCCEYFILNSGINLIKLKILHKYAKRKAGLDGVHGEIGVLTTRRFSVTIRVGFGVPEHHTLIYVPSTSNRN